MRRLVAALSLFLLPWAGCRGAKPGHHRARPQDAAPPCRGRTALQAMAEFHHRVIEPLGLSGEGLYTGDADPGRFRDLAALLRKTARRLRDWSSGDRAVDRLADKRASLLKAMAGRWEAMAEALEAHDQARFRRERERLIELRAEDLALRKELRALYLACGLTPPL